MASIDPDYDLVIGTFTAITRTFERVGFQGLTEPERVIFCTWSFVCEVNNGGFRQYFQNPSGEFAVETVAALGKVLMPNAASLLNQALSVFPNPAKDHNSRCEQLWSLPKTIRDDLFWELTTAFFDSTEDPYALQADYIRRAQ